MERFGYANGFSDPSLNAYTVLINARCGMQVNNKHNYSEFSVQGVTRSTNPA